MNSVQELVACVAGWLQEHGANPGAPAGITGETDLIGEGLLDSVGFIELLQILETESGRKIDLSTVDDFTTISGLWSAISPAAGGR